MTDEFKKILDLITKTKDKLVIYNTESDSSFVILPLAEYEELLTTKSDVKGLTEEKLLAKINQDVALWREDQKIKKDSQGLGEITEDLEDNI